MGGTLPVELKRGDVTHRFTIWTVPDEVLAVESKLSVTNSKLVSIPIFGKEVWLAFLTFKGVSL